MLKLLVTGNLGRDPEMRYAPDGTPVTSFSLASTRRYKTSDGQTQEQTTWLSVSVWGTQAEPCHQYLKKGSRVLVEGTLVADDNGHPKIWKGNDSAAHTSFDVRALHVEFLTPKSADQSGADESESAELESEPS